MTNSHTPTAPIVPLAFASILVLGVMVIITLATGVSQETFEIFREPLIYGQELRLFAMPVRALFALDSMFLILYATLIVLVARTFATAHNRAVIAIVIGAVLSTAVLDMIEDHFILAMLRAAERGIDPTVGQIAFQHTLSQVKFHLSYLGLFLLGLQIPRVSLGAKALAFFLTIGTLLQGAWLYAAPDALLPSGNMGRWVGFLIGFSLIIRLAYERAASATATDARA